MSSVAKADGFAVGSSSCRRVFLFTLLFWGVLTAAMAGEQAPASPTPFTSLPSIDALKRCLSGADSALCLDDLFRVALKHHSTEEALKLVRRFETEDPELRRDCHPVVHAIGRETFRIKGNIHESFSACDQTCHSGCYHGSVERFLRGDQLYSQVDRHPSGAELKQKASAACDPDLPLRLRFQCLHGLGHALMFFSRYQLTPALEACDALGEDWSRESCYGGVFMENLFNSAPELRDLSATDYHYPCNGVAARYRAACYVMQTSRMSEMGLPTSRLFEECRKAGEYDLQCTLSIGRDLSNEVRIGRGSPAAQACEQVADGRRLACMRGVIYALIDNTWDGRYALPFCAAFGRAGDQTACIQDSVQYLKTTFQRSAEEIMAECRRHLEQPARCREWAAP